MPAAALALLLVGLSSAPAQSPAASPTDPGLWVGATGRSLSGAVFQPLGEPARPLVRDARPTVVVVFASWCRPCLAELPSVIGDARRLAARVDFLGIDYSDPPDAGDALIARLRIPFPVERYQPATGPRRPHHDKGVDLSTTPPKKLPEVLPMLSQLLPEEAVANLRQIAARCKTMSDAQCVAFAQQRGVRLEGAQPPAHPVVQMFAGRTPTHALDLPHAFVIDGNGELVAEVSGFDPAHDEIAAALRKLGIR